MASGIAQMVGRRVHALRTQQGLTLEQLSTASGLPPESISRVERGRTGASLRTMDSLARGLGVRLQDLVSDERIGQVSGEALPPEVRGVVLLLATKPPAIIERARRIIEILVEE